MLIRYVALPTDEVRALQAGAPDAYGMTPERRTSDGDGVPALCRDRADLPARKSLRARRRDRRDPGDVPRDAGLHPARLRS